MPQNSQSSPLISIVIPARNEERVLGKCLDSLLRLNYANYEIVIVNDGSTDGTERILRQYPVQVLNTSGVGPSRGRNLGTQLARGEFVAFTDADCLLHPEWLTELLKGFETEKVAGVGGDQQSPADESPFGRRVQSFMKAIGFVADYMRDVPTVREVAHNPTCNVIYRKRVLEESGGFLETLWPGEDAELDHRLKQAGYSLVYNPEAIVYHYRPSTLRAYGKMMYRYGEAQAFLVKKYGPYRFIHFEPLALIVLALLWGIMWRYDKRWAWGLMALGIVLSCIIITWRTKGGLVSNLVLLIYTLVGWNLGFLKGLLETRQE